MQWTLASKVRFTNCNKRQATKWRAAILAQLGARGSSLNYNITRACVGDGVGVIWFVHFALFFPRKSSGVAATPTRALGWCVVVLFVCWLYYYIAFWQILAPWWYVSSYIQKHISVYGICTHVVSIWSQYCIQRRTTGWKNICCSTALGHDKTERSSWRRKLHDLKRRVRRLPRLIR